MPKGQRDYSAVRLTRHALDRYAERFAARRDGDDAATADEVELRNALRRTRQLGTSPQGAVAVLAVARNRALVAILQAGACLTVLTWPQFAPRLAEFGRTRLPRKPGRMLKRLSAPESGQSSRDDVADDDDLRLML